LPASRSAAARAAAGPAVRWSVGSRERTDQGSANGRLVGGRVEFELDDWYSVEGGPGCQDGGDEETRTPDPLLAKEMLCQLSYVPADRSTTVVGVSGLEPEASALSGQCSNQLS
jgi:hypothetical protein